MVSPVLAQAILNPSVPDVVGQFRAGREEARQSNIRRLTGLAAQGEEGAIDELKGVAPQVAFALAEQIGAANANDLNNFVKSARISENLLAAGNTQGALDFANQRIRELGAQGRDTTQTENFRRLLLEDPNRALQEARAFTSAVDGAKGLTASEQEFRSLTEGLAPEEVERARRIKLGLERRAGLTSEDIREREQAKADVEIETERSLNEIIRDREKGKALGKGEAEALTGFIETGIDAAERLPDINRGLELLDRVETGGLTAQSKVVTDFFGSTGGDVAELNRILAQNVLAGLANFKGAISDSERRFLERMETNLAAGTEFNRRELQRMQKLLNKQVNRGKRAAERAGDDFSLELFEENVSVTPSGFGGARVDATQESVQESPSGETFTSSGGISFTVK